MRRIRSFALYSAKKNFPRISLFGEFPPISTNKITIFFVGLLPATKTLEVYVQYGGRQPYGIDDSIERPCSGLFSFPYDHFAAIRWQATTRQPGAKVEKIFNIANFCQFHFLQMLYECLGQRSTNILKRDLREGTHTHIVIYQSALSNIGGCDIKGLQHQI